MNQVYLYTGGERAHRGGLERRLNPFMNQVYLYKTEGIFIPFEGGKES